MKTVKYLLLATSFITTVSTINAAEGPEIFKTNCTTCHTVGKGKLVGPDLKNVDQRHDEKWLNKWIRSSQTMVKNKDPKAVELFNNNNQIPMPDFAQLKEKDIKALLNYIKTESASLTEVAKTPDPVVKIMEESRKKGNDPFISFFRDNPVSIFFFCFVLLLLGVVVVLVKALTSLTRAGYKRE